MSNTNKRPKKLQRISQACDLCHRRSIRCRPSTENPEQCQNCYGKPLHRHCSLPLHRPRRPHPRQTIPLTNHSVPQTLQSTALTIGLPSAGANIRRRKTPPLHCRYGTYLRGPLRLYPRQRMTPGLPSLLALQIFPQDHPSLHMQPKRLPRTIPAPTTTSAKGRMRIPSKSRGVHSLSPVSVPLMSTCPFIWMSSIPSTRSSMDRPCGKG